MRPPAFDPTWERALLHPTTGALRGLLRAMAHHTGLPVIFVTAVTLVLSWRLLKRLSGLAVEVAIAVGLLLAATRFGWLQW
ncbi:MAG: hypothetical protein ACREJ3_18885 [Polyangiaceae bacterium]